ncbi:GIN domain-containing protein [Aquimarina sp. 2201CG5-10]|uniref:GIN domain-containing protein n=1 Tax=Aquimarina callyspongiae TaxID=3098150 RepID=UPI002AB426DB|nr:DUF2807 domain-containing protein [Aquimarina sp. 2201CG5-10]MDY8135640.1 DUF2807 domain-containing protein [Aquimarina sp. 2201CG5-10]
MKKSNLMILITLGIIFFFFMAFQFKIHSHIQKGAIDEDSDIISETRSLQAFKKISVNHGITVLFKQDSTTQISIESPESLMPYITTEVVNNELIIKKTKRIKSYDSITVSIINDQLYELKVDSWASFITKGMITGKDIKLDFNNKSTGNLEISYATVKCKASSNSKIKITGNSKHIDFSNH